MSCLLCRAASAVFVAVLLVALAGCSGGGTSTPGNDLRDGVGGADVPLVLDVPDQGGTDPSGDAKLPPRDVPPDVPRPVCSGEPGSFGCPCRANGECTSGFCVPSDEGYVCTEACLSVCPAGWDCRAVPQAAPDIQFVCWPGASYLCQPCAHDAQCGGGACLELADGWRCGRDCSPTRPCPEGYACGEVAELGILQCLPISGACDCGPWLPAEQRTRACHNLGEGGACWGEETCDLDDGWSECTARTPAAEDCNGDDDDCDGRADEDALPPDEPCEETNADGTCRGDWQCRGTEGWVCTARTPEPEACNYRDDDCDGETDEGFRDGVTGLYLGNLDCGVCGHSCDGAILFATASACASVGDGAACVASACEDGYYVPADNPRACVPVVATDCSPCTADGQCQALAGGRCEAFDDGRFCTRACTVPEDCPARHGCEDGRCRPTTDSCSCLASEDDGRVRTCFAASAAGTCAGSETCDSDGAPGWSACSAPLPTAEVCNGRDDDCNLLVDEALVHDPPTCGETNDWGTCPGTWACAGEDGWVCGAREAAEERCNYVDDDCDGLTDEGFRGTESGPYVDDTNCGACGVTCLGAIPHAAARCVLDGATPRCTVATCDAGYWPVSPLACVPATDDICTPCGGDGTCPTPGDRCLAIDGGQFCGRDCAEGNRHGRPAGECPAGFDCEALPDGARQCVPSSGSCACLAADEGTTRTCVRSGTAGTCYGEERCTWPQGFTGCTATTPATETCNGRDDDCNGTVDDLPGRGAACTIANSFGTCSGVRDCVAGQTTLQCVGQTPVAETCNGRDDTCDGRTDEALTAPACEEQDGVCRTSRKACGGVGGWLACTSASYGAAYEAVEVTCDDQDNDCDGQTDEVDLDRDGATDEACGGTDCDDLNPLAHPGAAEVCGDQVDNDCNGRAEDRDADGDGSVSAACGGPDCNDATPLAKPGRAEVCGDTLDNDCDGSIDNLDADRDTFLAPACGGADCDDGRAGVHPGAAEACDGLDNDCNGATDDKDTDADGHRDATAPCGGDDCDDASPVVHPGMDEVCGNAIDEDCSGQRDDRDLDSDGYRDRAPACGGTDCDDRDPLVYPGATEIYDTKDTDCDGVVDEGLIPVGAILVSEVMQNSRAVDDLLGEWFEVYNDWNMPVNLHSWTFSDIGSPQDTFTVDAPGGILVPPGGTAVFCRNDSSARNGGVECDYAYDDMSLGNDDDEIIVTHAGLEIDRIVYTGASPWPDPDGRSMALDPASFSRTGNDAGGNWCATPAGYLLPSGDGGTPGVLNPSCTGDPVVTAVTPGDGVDNGGETITILGSGFTGTTAVRVGGTACASFVVLDDHALSCVTPAHAAGDVDVVVTKGTKTTTLTNGYRYTGEAVRAIDWADIQWPRETTAAEGVPSELIFGQVHSPGVTEPAGAPTGIRAQVGYGPAGTDPRNAPGWRWTDAVWHRQYFANDEFRQTLTVPEPGSYSFVFRFSDDGGIHYMYGDFDPGTADGFTVSRLGSLTVQ